MKTCGLDVASCTGMALVGEDEDRGKTVHLPNQKGFQRLHLVAQEIERTLNIWQPELVAVERYAYCKNISSFVVLVELGTVIRSVLYKLGMPWFEIPPMTLKKWTTGYGHAKKEDMAVAVKARWGYTSDSHDIVDAYALAQMAQLEFTQLEKLKGVEQGAWGEKFVPFFGR